MVYIGTATLASLFILGVSMLLLAFRIHMISAPILGPKLISKEKLLKTVNNGDIIFFSGNTFGEKTIKWYHGSEWSHCSLVVRDTNSSGVEIPFIFESDLGQGYNDGPRVMPLEEKLSRWKGDNIIAVRKYKGGVIPKEKILTIATEYYKNGYGFDKKMYSWFFSHKPDSPIYRYLKDSKNVFCSELVADTLQRLNIIPNDHIASWYTPEYLFSTIKSYGKPKWCDTRVL